MIEKTTVLMGAIMTDAGASAMVSYYTIHQVMVWLLIYLYLIDSS